jgi:hypothetical protein
MQKAVGFPCRPHSPRARRKKISRAWKAFGCSLGPQVFGRPHWYGVPAWACEKTRQCGMKHHAGGSSPGQRGHGSGSGPGNNNSSSSGTSGGGSGGGGGVAGAPFGVSTSGGAGSLHARTSPGHDSGARTSPSSSQRFSDAKAYVPVSCRSVAGVGRGTALFRLAVVCKGGVSARVIPGPPAVMPPRFTSAMRVGFPCVQGGARVGRGQAAPREVVGPVVRT